MSNTMYNVVMVMGKSKDRVLKLTKAIASKGTILDGEKVSPKWESPYVDEPNLKIYEEFEKHKEKWPELKTWEPDEAEEGEHITCARYCFYSHGGGGGLGEYFEDISKKFPDLKFVVMWIYLDFMEFGLEEIVDGNVYDNIFLDDSCDIKEYMKTAEDCMDWEFPEDFLEEHGGNNE